MMLTSDIIQTVVKRAMLHRYGQITEELEKIRRELIERCWSDIHKPHTEWLLAAPPKWLVQSNSLWRNYGSVNLLDVLILNLAENTGMGFFSLKDIYQNHAEKNGLVAKADEKHPVPYENLEKTDYQEETVTACQNWRDLYHETAKQAALDTQQLYGVLKSLQSKRTEVAKVVEILPNLKEFFDADMYRKPQELALVAYNAANDMLQKPPKVVVKISKGKQLRATKKSERQA